MTSRQKVGVVTPTGFWQSDPTRSTINIEYYYHALREIGCDSLIVCPDGSECSDAVEWTTAPLERYRDPEFWRSLGLDAAIFFTWLGYTPEVKAMRDAGVKVISRADTSGADSVRVFPREMFAYFVQSKKDPMEKLRQTKNWLHCYLSLYKQYDAERIESCKLADVIAVETETARQRLDLFFRYHGQPKLPGKMVVCPHLLSEDILKSEMPGDTSTRQGLVAIGRWDDWQKDSPLLKASLEQHLQRHPDRKVVIIGKGAEVFAPLTAKYPTVQCTGPIPRDHIKRYLREAQTLVVTSQWESFHIAAHEALCLGCTVVGPEVIPLPDICGAGDYGIMVPQRSPALLAAALDTEKERWQKGERDPQQIASFWRERLRPTAVVQRMLTAVGAGSGNV